MSFEPFLVFFLILHLRKKLKKYAPDEQWEKFLLQAAMGAVILFIVPIVLSIQHITVWIWYLLLLLIAYSVFKLPQFSSVRTLIVAFLPLIIISFIKNIVPFLPEPVDKTINKYVGF